MTKMKWKKWSALGCSFALAAFLGFMIPSWVTRAAEMASAPTVTVQCGGRPLNVQTPNGQKADYGQQVFSQDGYDGAFTVEAPGTVSYILDQTGGADVKNEAELSGLQWTPLSDKRIQLPGDGKYLLYLQVSVEETVTYHCCCATVDTTSPVFVGITAGETYPIGTTFTVDDLTSVEVFFNENPVAAKPDAQGRYTVETQGYSNSCVIKAKDAAGNEASARVFIMIDAYTPVNGQIDHSQRYYLNANTPYTLAGGTWTMNQEGAADPNMYTGGITVYVKNPGFYTLGNYWDFDWSTWWKNWWKQQ